MSDVNDNPVDPYEIEAKRRVRVSWVANRPDASTASDGSPLYCPDHGRYVGFRGVFPCPDCE